MYILVLINVQIYQCFSCEKTKTKQLDFEKLGQPEHNPQEPNPNPKPTRTRTICCLIMLSKEQSNTVNGV